MNGNGLTKVKIFRVRMPGSPEAKNVITTGEHQGLTEVEEVIELPTCPCGTVIHNIGEAAAFCVVRGEPLCEECAKTKCCICGKTACLDDLVETMSGKKACRTHRMLRRLLA